MLTRRGGDVSAVDRDDGARGRGGERKLDEGPLITAQLTDLDGAVNIGDRVEMVTRKLTAEGPQGVIVYGYKFRKALERDNS